MTQERDTALEKLYRAQAQELPPSHIDEAILAAAKREIGAGPISLAKKKGLWKTWRWPVAVAAVLVLSLSLVSVMPPDELYDSQREVVPISPPHSAASSIVVEKKAPSAPALPSPSPSQAARPSKAGKEISNDGILGEEYRQRSRNTEEEKDTNLLKREFAKPAPELKEQSRTPRAQQDDEQRKPIAVAEPAASPAASRRDLPSTTPQVAIPQETTSKAAQELLADKRAEPARDRLIPKASNEKVLSQTVPLQEPPPLAATANPAQPALVGAQAAKEKLRSPQEWLNLIRRLRAEGRHQEAYLELTAFKLAYPDYLLPEDLR